MVREMHVEEGNVHVFCVSHHEPKIQYKNSVGPQFWQLWTSEHVNWGSHLQALGHLVPPNIQTIVQQHTLNHNILSPSSGSTQRRQNILSSQK